MKNKLEKILEYLVYLFIFLLPWQAVWIIRESFIDGFKWHQGTFLIYVIEILLVFVFLLSLFNFKIKKINKKIFIPIFFLVFWSALSIVWSGNKLLSFFWFLKILEGVVIFLVVINCKIDFKKIYIAFVLSGFFQSVLAIWQFFTQKIVASKWLGMSSHLPSDIYSSVVGVGGIRWLRAYGTFSHPNILGGFLVVCFLFVVYLYFNYSAGWKKIFSLIAIIFISTGLFFSFSRSAILAVIISYFFIFVYFIFKKKFEIIKLSFYLLFLFVFLFSAYRPLVLARVYGSERLEEKSIEQRIDSLREAKSIILDNPFLGVGIGNYTNYLSMVKPDFPGWHYQPAHNIYLMVLAELGVVGFFLFGLILFFAFYLSSGNPFVFSTLIVFLVVGFFDHYLWTSYFGIVLFWFILSLSFKTNNPVNFFKKINRRFLLELSYYTGRNFYSPRYVSLITTFKCNFRCRTCDIWKKDNFNELDLVDWLAISEKLKKELSSDTFIEINGGEALLNKDLTIGLIKNLKTYFQIVVLNTNGSTINDEVVANLKLAGLNKIKLSLYSLDSDTHNFLRGTDLAFSSAYRAIDVITRSGIDLEVGILITSKNISSISKLVEYLNTLKNISIIIQPLDEIVESSNSKNMSSNVLLSGLWPKKNDVINLFSWLKSNGKSIKNSSANLKAIEDYYLDPKSSLQYHCFAGQRNLVIYPNGNLSLCFKGGIVGNLSDGDLNSILKTAKTERKRIKKCGKYCRIIGCNFSVPIFRRR
jgi:MoaA/NifB/PqqE/SkfB family radical SAM enzyme/O-antigen ligase